MKEFEIDSNPDGYIYQSSLNFTQKTLNKIIEEIYILEKHEYSSPTGRTFKITNGFHSINLLDKSNGILDKYFYLTLLCSRVQEIIFNTMKNKKTNIDFLNLHGGLEIKEIWCNILRKGDYNIPHIHANHTYSGNFYLNNLDPKKKSHSTDGQLCFIKLASYNHIIPNSNEGITNFIEPKSNLGVIFRSWKRHMVIPHFSDEDRIGIAFNAVYNPKWSYDKIYPKPYWIPHKLNYYIKEEYVKNNYLQVIFDLSNWKKFKQLKNVKNTSLNMNIENKEKYINEILILTYKNLKNFLNLYPEEIKSFFL